MGITLPAPLSGQSHLETLNATPAGSTVSGWEQAFAFAAENGYSYTDAQKEQIITIARRHVGEFNGPLFEGGVAGGAIGGIEWFFKFLQEMARLMQGGTEFKEALSTASANAGTTTTAYSAVQGLGRMKVAMDEAGIAGSDLLTGVSVGNTFTRLPGVDYSRSLMGQISAANHLGDKPVSTTLNLDPAQRPDAGHVIEAGPSGDSSIVTPPAGPAQAAAPAARIRS